MSESFIMEFIPHRLKQLAYVSWHIRHRDFLIGPGEALMIPAYNELFFLVDDPESVIVDSDYGLYHLGGSQSGECMHQHRGEIIVTNLSDQKNRVKFIQVIIVN